MLIERAATRAAMERDVTIQHGQEVLDVGRVACLDHPVEDQAALPLVRLSLWPYQGSRLPLTMMSACGSNRLTSF